MSKKGKIDKISLPTAKVSSAFRWRQAAKELIEEEFSRVYKIKPGAKKTKGPTSIVEGLLLQHLGITEERVQERITHPKKAGK